jgi:hypothetical protein
MNIESLQSLFLKHKESSLFHRYITNENIEPLLDNLSDNFGVEIIEKSVLNRPIYAVKIGTGEKRILMWSQMHGNESTTTKALFDLFNTFKSEETEIEHILKTCTVYFIPILNPDGAKAYTRINANKVDLNRDAQDLTQPESEILKTVFENFKPHFCFNLHGQRTIFSVGKTNKPATVSFLAPAQDKACTITPNRKVAMEVIGVMNDVLQLVIPNQVGVYDDAFNLNCVGDTFQSNNIPTILFEAGHFANDYAREQTREYIYLSLIASLNYIAKNDVDGKKHKSYFKIPENDKCFYDIIIRNAKTNDDSGNRVEDIGIMYQEKLVEGKINFIPKIEKIENLNAFFGHKEIEAKKTEVLDNFKQPVKVNNENVFVMINNEKISLLLK